jgi:transcriptional regulator with XRE-family HTH domain
MKEGKTIRHIREDKGLTQLELASLSGISAATINGIEKGRVKTTTTKTLYRLAEALEVSVRDFFNPEDE